MSSEIKIFGKVNKTKILLKNMLTKTPGIHEVNVTENLEALFNLDSKVGKSAPYLFPLETKEKFLEFLEGKHKSNTWILNDLRGNLVGYISLIDMPKEESMEIWSICVDPDFQGKGYGKNMMDFAEKVAKQNKRKKLILVTNIKNQTSVPFYKKQGYKIVKEIENHFGDGETRYLFEKTI